MSDIMTRLRELADLFEAGDAPRHVALHMRAGADEIERLRAGGCARNQGTTQFCAEAAAKISIIRRLTLKEEHWRGALLNIAQGKGDPVAVACKALEADNV